MWRERRASTKLCWSNRKFPLGEQLNIVFSRRGGLPRRHTRILLGRILLGTASTLAFALTLGSPPASARHLYGYGYERLPDRSARHKSAHKEKDTERASKDPFGQIPKGPLFISVSINQQKLHFYSNGTHVADEPVATGMPGHPTPMGVFDIIQRDRFHHSNIYSNAPMPFMERITWSGVALHEGVGLGHPASHGCIRMPHDFAARLWQLPTMGMRVIIARGEVTPSEFSDPHLFVHKDLPPVAAVAPTPAPSSAPPVKTAQSVDATRTADAPPADAAMTVKPSEIGLRGSGESSVPDAAAAAKPDVAAADAPKPDAPKSDTTKSDTTKSDTPKAETPAADVASAGPPAQVAPKTEPAAATDTATTSAAPVVQTAVPATADVTPSATAAPDVPAPLSKLAEQVRDAVAKKKPIAIFVSRKEKKIYVRQNLEPLFDAAITIEHPEQPLGTHVFTAMEFLGADRTALRWTVVSLPGDPPAKPVRKAENDSRNDRHTRGRRRDEDDEKPAAETPPQNPAAVLARLDIPQETIDYISQLMIPGSSLVVSDQGLGEETGEGTDFIVVTR